MRSKDIFPGALIISVFVAAYIVTIVVDEPRIPAAQPVAVASYSGNPMSADDANRFARLKNLCGPESPDRRQCDGIVAEPRLNDRPRYYYIANLDGHGYVHAYGEGDNSTEPTRHKVPAGCFAPQTRCEVISRNTQKWEKLRKQYFPEVFPK